MNMDIVQEVISSLESEPRVMLATIIATSGSTPASSFSKMMVKDGGLVSVGTVGGGCMEGDVLAAAQRLHVSGKAEILAFHLTEDEYVQGLICGGTAHVLIEPMTRSDVPWLEALAERRREGEDCVLATFIKTDGVIQKRALMVPNPSGWNPDDLETLRDIIGIEPSQDLHKALNRHQTRRITTAGGELILEPIAGIPALVIFGGGHVSKHLSKAASLAGFRVTVVDDREQYANPGRFPEAARTIALPFDQAVKELAVSSSTFIVIVTRGHRSDEEILEQVILTEAGYIGMIGSKRKVLATYQNLMERGVPADELRRVFAPVGLEIGAVTAEEIAISIVAQLIRVRRRVDSPVTDKSGIMKPLITLREHKLSLG